ncbi:MAG TPA: FecR family protein, partial [Puia sp.]|nr:FecR family protein [Puia sp.]
GKTTRTVQKDSTVVEGERIVTDKDSKATVQLFDGSQIDINPNTDLALTKMQKPSAKDKILQFKLFIGSLLSKVKKLASSKSSFEIEAGGVVCGVRGTQYSYSYDPKAHNVTVHVDEGTVYLNSNGHTYLFTAGQTGIFTNGLPAVQKPGSASNPPPGGVNPTGISSLGDLNQQFGNSLAVNGDNNFTNPSVGGSLHINVHVNVSPPETVP